MQNKQNFVLLIIRQLVFVSVFAVSFEAGSAGAAGKEKSAELVSTTKLLIQILSRNHGSIDILQRKRIIQLPQTVPLRSDHTNLPKPTDAGLGDAIHMMAFYAGPVIRLNLVWMPPVDFGGVNVFEGSGDCETWIMFTADTKATHRIPTPPIFEPGICILDGGQSYLGIFKNHVVALTTAIYGDQTSGYKMLVQAQSWDGMEWTLTEETIIHLLTSHATKSSRSK